MLGEDVDAEAEEVLNELNLLTETEDSRIIHPHAIPKYTGESLLFFGFNLFLSTDFT